MGIIFKTFLDFHTKIPSSTYKNAKAAFSKREYQSNDGNPKYAHIILAVDREKLSEEKSVLVKKIGRASILDVI